MVIVIRDHEILMNAIYKSSVPKKLTDKLNGEITIPEFIIIFKSVMDEKFDLLF